MSRRPSRVGVDRRAESPLACFERSGRTESKLGRRARGVRPCDDHRRDGHNACQGRECQQAGQARPATSSEHCQTAPRRVTHPTARDVQPAGACEQRRDHSPARGCRAVRYASGVGDEERVVLSAGLGRCPIGRAGVDGRGRFRAALLVPVDLSFRRRGRAQHLGWDQERAGEALWRIRPGLGRIRRWARLGLGAAPLARSSRSVDDVSVLLVHLLAAVPSSCKIPVYVFNCCQLRLNDLCLGAMSGVFGCLIPRTQLRTRIRG